MSKNSQPNNDENLPNIANWKTSAYSRWAFHHVHQLIPTVAIENDTYQHNFLEKAAKAIKGITIKLLLKATATDAVVILHEGKIVYESYKHGNNAHTPHILMSATKAVVGLIAGILEHKGAIDLSAAVSFYVPETNGTVYQKVTLRQLLDMRSGIEFDEDQQKDYDISTNWEPVPEGYQQKNLHEFYASLKHSQKSNNEYFNYVSANTDLLGWAIENATGRSFSSLLSDLLWKPMGAEKEAYLTVDKDGFPRCTGGFCATARDFALIGQLILDGGVRNSKEIIPRSVIEDITNNGDHHAWEKGQWGKAFAPLSKNMSYRSGWYTMNDHPKLLFAMGIYGQNLFVDQTNNLVIAKFSSWKKPTDYIALPLTHLIVKKVRKLLNKNF